MRTAFFIQEVSNVIIRAQSADDANVELYCYHGDAALAVGKHTLNPGDQVTVTIRPAKNGAPIGQLLKVELANGQTLVGWNPGVR